MTYPCTGIDRPRGLQEVEDFQLSHERDKVVSLSHWPPVPPWGDPWYSFLLDDESTPGS